MDEETHPFVFSISMTHSRQTKKTEIAKTRMLPIFFFYLELVAVICAVQNSRGF
jgi:hypothetical protein